MDYFERQVFQGGLTYNGHPLGLAAAIANIRVLQSDKLIDRARERGAMLAQELEKMASSHACIGAFRSIGLMAALDLVTGDERATPLGGYAQASATIQKLREDCLANGLYLRSHMSSLLIMPPLMIDDADLSSGLEILDACLDRYEAGR